VDSSSLTAMPRTFMFSWVSHTTSAGPVRMRAYWGHRWTRPVYRPTRATWMSQRVALRGQCTQCRVNRCRGRCDGCPTPGADAWGRTLIANRSDRATAMTITAIRTVVWGRGFRFRRIVASVCAG
jgi:hypothetical protein